MPLFLLPTTPVAKPRALADVDPNSMPMQPQPGLGGIKAPPSKTEQRHLHIVQTPSPSETAACLTNPSRAPKNHPQKPLGPSPGYPSTPSPKPSARSLYERRHADGTALSPLTVSDARAAYSDSKCHSRGQDTSGFPSSPAYQVPSVHQLKSNSGMSLHTNTSALRRYTDYNDDGSPRFPEFPNAGRFDAKYEPDHGHAASTPPPLFSRSTVKAVMEDPVARQHLCDYMRSQRGVENLDFLERVEEYTKALQSVTALVAGLSTSFTSVAAATPLRLPSQLSKSLNADIKHVSSSIIPGLHTLFGQASAHIEDRIVRDIYPAFVKRQFAVRMKTALGAPLNSSSGHAPFSLAGLGNSFCIVDPHRSDNPVVYASDAFAKVLGYANADEVPRSGRLLKIPQLGNNGTFSEGILMTHRRQNNEPFWSHVSVCPIASPSGRVRFLLVGLTDMSAAVQTQSDILRALAVDSPVARGANRNSTISCVNTENSANTGFSGDSAVGMSNTFPSSSMEAYTTPVPSSAPSPEPGFRTRSRIAANCSLSSWKTSKPSTSPKPLFHMFSRKRNTDAVAPEDEGPAENVDEHTDIPTATTQWLHPDLTTLLTKAETPNIINQHFKDDLPVYASFMLLQFVPGSHASEELQPPTFLRPSSRRSNHQGFKSPQAASFSEPARLKVAFASRSALDLLGICAAAEDSVVYKDVFNVLSGLAGSSSITSEFRATVCERVGTSTFASMELSVPEGNVRAMATSSEGDLGRLAVPTGTIQDGGEAKTGRRSRRFSELVVDPPKCETKSSSVWENRPSTGWRSRSPRMQRKSSSPERPATSDWNGRKSEQGRKLMSHWTPLKDVDGSVAWVILVLAPVLNQA